MTSIGLTNQELTQIRADIAGLFPDTGHILSVTRVSDGQGGFTETWGTATANVACRMDAENGAETLSVDTLKTHHRYTVTMANDVTITTAHRFKYGSNTYNIESVNDDQSWIGCKRAVLEVI